MFSSFSTVAKRLIGAMTLLHKLDLCYSPSVTNNYIVVEFWIGEFFFLDVQEETNSCQVLEYTEQVQTYRVQARFYCTVQQAVC